MGILQFVLFCLILGLFALPSEPARTVLLIVYVVLLVLIGLGMAGVISAPGGT